MSARDTMSIGTTDATDTLIQSKDVAPEYGRFATLQNPGIKPTDPRATVAMLTQILEDAERYRQAYEPEWLTLYSQYHGSTSTDGKANWQSTVHAPFSKRDVDTIASRIVSIVFSEERWYDIQPDNRQGNNLKDIAMNTIMWQLRRGRYREPLETSIKDALICGTGPMKMTYERVLKPQMASDMIPGDITTLGGRTFVGKDKFKVRRAMRPVAGIQMRPIIPTDFWLDPSGQNRYVIHRTKRHLSDLWKLTEPQVDPATGVELMPAIYDRDEVSKIRPGSRDRKLDQFASTIRRERYLAYEDMTVDVYEIWGDIPDPSTGVTMYPNCFATFVDKQWLLRKPQENPWWHQRLPFIDFRSMLNPHQIYGYGFLMQGSLLQLEIDKALQVMVDKMVASFGMVEVDTSAARNSEDFGGSNMKVDPLRMFAKRGERPIFTPIKISEGATPADVQVYTELQKAYEMCTGVNEWSTGSNQTTTRKTAKEAEIKVAASQTQFSDIGQYMEEHSLSPFIQMIWELSIQFETQWMNPQLLQMFEDNPQAAMLLQAYAAMPPEERWAKMNMEAQFRVDGVTRQVTKQARLDRTINFLKVASGNQAISSIIDWRVILQEIITDFDQPANVVLPQSEAVLQAAEQAVLAQFAMMMQGAAQPQQPGQPPPPGGGPPGMNGPNQAKSAQGQAESAGPPQ